MRLSGLKDLWTGQHGKKLGWMRAFRIFIIIIMSMDVCVHARLAAPALLLEKIKHDFGIIRPIIVSSPLISEIVWWRVVGL
jgi:hypothetical protein